MSQENSCIHFHILSWWSGNKIALLSSFNKTVKVTRLLLIQKINELSYSTFMLSRCEVLFSIVVSYSFSRHFVVGEEFFQQEFLSRIFYQELLHERYEFRKKLNWEWCMILNCIFNFFPEDIMECLFVLIHEVRSVAIFLIYSVLQNFNSI